MLLIIGIFCALLSFGSSFQFTPDAEHVEVICSARIIIDEEFAMYRLLSNENAEISVYSFMSNYFGIRSDDDGTNSIRNGLLEFVNSPTCRGNNTITQSLCNVNKFQRIELNIQTAIKSFALRYLFYDCEVYNLLGFFTKAAVFCTFHGLYDLNRNCTYSIFQYAKDYINDTSPFNLKELEISSKQVFPLLYGLTWSNIIDNNIETAQLFGLAHEYGIEYRIEFLNKYLLRKLDSEALYRRTQQNYLEISILNDLDISNLANVSWLQNINTAFDKILFNLNSEEYDIIEHEWIDLDLCLQIMVNVNIHLVNYVVPAKTEFVSTIFGMHSAAEGNDFICQGSMHGSLWPWIPRFRDKPWLYQHLQSISPIVPSNLPWAAYISVYDWFSYINIAHILNSGELFWSFAASMPMSSTLQSSVSGVILFALSPPSGKRQIQSSVSSFFKLYYRALTRYAIQLGLLVFVENMELLENVIVAGFEAGDFSLSNVVELQENHHFPILLEKPVNNVMTPQGCRLMQQYMWYECAQSVPMSPQYEFYRQGPHLHQRNTVAVGILYDEYAKNRQEQDSPKVVLASRSGPRFIANMDEVVTALHEYFNAACMQTNRANITIKLEVIVVDFGKLSPCEQMHVMASARLFIFVHGAEGALTSFLQPFSNVIEMHPAGCCIYDFHEPENYEYYYQPDAHAALSNYYFFTGTVASSWACSSWMQHMMSAPYCGTIVIVSELIETLNFIFTLN